jgi:hypothetical protein
VEEVMPRTKRTKSPTTDVTAPAEGISFDKAVAEGQEIILNIEAAERGQLRLGELADKLEPKYGDRTLAKFAEAIGVAKCTLDRYRTVYRAWAGKLAPGPNSFASYAILRELATHPNREQIIKAKPNISKREAHDYMRDIENDARRQQQQEQEDDWLKHNRRWFKELYTHAHEACRRAEVALNATPEKQRELSEVVVEREMPQNLKMYGGVLIQLANLLEAEQEAAREEREAQAAQEPKRSTRTAKHNGHEASAVV